MATFTSRHHEIGIFNSRHHEGATAIVVIQNVAIQESGNGYYGLPRSLCELAMTSFIHVPTFLLLYR